MAKSFVFHFENTAKPSFDYTSSLLKPSYTTKHYRESGLRSRSRSREYESPSYKSNYQKNKGYHKEDSPRKGGFVYEFPSKLDHNEKYSHEYRNKPYKERERERSPRRKSRFHFHSDPSDIRIDREFEDAVEAFMQSEKKRNEMIQSENPSNSSKIEVERLNQPLDELEEKGKTQSASVSEENMNQNVEKMIIEEPQTEHSIQDQIETEMASILEENKDEITLKTEVNQDSEPSEDPKENLKEIILIEDEIEPEIITNKLCERLINLDLNITIQDPRKRAFLAQNHNDKLNLVLDLDETILNSYTLPKDFDLKSVKNIPSHLLNTMTFGETKVLLVFRPYTNEFLTRVSNFYNIYVYSHGKYEYVQKILEMVDKEEKFIKRDLIFKNTGQVKDSTPKLLTKLGLTSDQINKTLILDDQRNIWIKDHHRVLCSKKFIPLRKYLKNDKFNKYFLFNSRQNKPADGSEKRWLVHQEDQSELEYYSETHYHGSKSTQLEALTKVLENIAQDYIKALKSVKLVRSLNIATFYELKMKSLLKGMKIAVISASKARKDMFEELAMLLGAIAVETGKAHYLITDERLEEDQKDIVEELMEEKPMIMVISLPWLLECFFHINKINPQKFTDKRFYR